MIKLYPTNQVGTTHSDANGYYAFEVTPAMTAAGPGMYTVHASFAGSHAYWPSQAESSFAIGAAATPAPTSAPPESTADAYFVPAIVGLFVLFIVVAVVLALLMLRKK